MKTATYWDGSQTCGTLSCRNAGGAQRMPDKQHFNCVIQTQDCLNPWDVQSKHIQPPNGIAEALYAGECRYGGGESYVLQTEGDENMSYQDTTGSLLASGYNKLGTQEAANDMYITEDPVYSSTTGDYMVSSKEQTSTLMARDYKDPPITAKAHSVVRRLTPKECERLQGFPDDWTNIGEWTDSNGKRHKDADSPRYKALGNSIALPFWKDLAKRICAQYDRPTTMASLFDGIGGFPLAFQEAGCTPVWASEIEEFPIAVTKLRFPGETFDDYGCLD